MKILNYVLVLMLAVSLTACAGQKKQMKCVAATSPATEVVKKEAVPAAEAAKPAEAPKPVLPTAYIVKSNDSLERISRKKEIYGDGLMWPVIFEANRDKLASPSMIYPGQKLRIPRDTKEIAILKQRADANRVRQSAVIHRPKPVAKPAVTHPAQAVVTPQASTPTVSETAPVPAVQVPETVAVPAAPAAEALPSEAKTDTAMPVVEETGNAPTPTGTNQ